MSAEAPPPPAGPAGWTVSLATNNFLLGPGQAASTSLTVTSPASLGSDTYLVTVIGYSYPNFSLQGSATVGYLVASTQTADFGLSATPGSVTIRQGQSGQTTVSTNVVAGFSSPVALSATGLPVGMAVSFNPASLAGAGSSIATLSVTNSVAAGSYLVTVTGTSGLLSHSTLVSVNVSALPQLTAIALSPQAPTLPVGSTLQFNAIGAYTDNALRDITNQVSWSSSNTLIADIAAGGLASGKASGTSDITATLDGKSQSSLLTVSSATGCQRANPMVTVTPALSPVGNPGRTESFNVTVKNQDNPDCSSSSFLLNAVAPVDPITAAPQTGWTISLVSSVFSLAPGQSASTTLQVRSPFGQADGAYEVVLTAVNWPVFSWKGIATATYQVHNNAVDFSVSAAPPTITVARSGSGNVSVTTSVTGAFSSSIDLSVTGLPSGVTAEFAPATIPAPGSGNSILTLSANASALTGTFGVSVRAISGTTVRTAPLSLTVTTAPATLTKITVVPVNSSMIVGNSQQYVASGTYSDGSSRNITNQVIWSSSMPDVATVDSVGMVTALTTGSTDIGASLAPISDSTPLTVTPADPGCVTSAPGLVITPTITAPGAAGRTESFNVTVTSMDTAACGFEGRHSILLSTGTLPYGWTVTFATSSFQMLPGASASTTMLITSAASSANATYGIDVSATNLHVFKTQTQTVQYIVDAFVPPDFAIAVTPGSGSVKQGNSIPVTVTSTLTGGFNQPVGLTATGLPPRVTATFIPENLPSPGSGNSALSIAAAPDASMGNYDVTVTGTAGSITHSVHFALTITSGAAISLSRIDVTPPDPTITVGGTQLFHAIGTYSDSSTQDLSTQVSWLSSAPSVATVNASGQASGVGTGSTVISAILGALGNTTSLTVISSLSGCVHANPQVTVTAISSIPGPAGRLVTYFVEVKNLDGADCAASKFLTSATPTSPTPPDGWTITTSVPSVTLAPGATGSLYLNVISPATLGNGTWPLTATVANWPVFTFASTAGFTYIVGSPY